MMNLFEYKNNKLYWKPEQKWRGGKEVGCYDKDTGYCRVGFQGKYYYVHRIVWEFHNGKVPKDMQIDHINGKRADNRIENLQLVTPRQNQQRRADGKCFVFDIYKKERPYKAVKWRKYIGYYGTPCGAYMETNTHAIQNYNN